MNLTAILSAFQVLVRLVQSQEFQALLKELFSAIKKAWKDATDALPDDTAG